MSDPIDDLEVALAATAAGAAVVRAAYGQPVHRTAKAGTDFATDADLAAERAILDVIAAHRPADAVDAEESGRGSGASGRRWLVDPLCGTLNFAAATPFFAVNVALQDASGTVVGVSADPIARETFWASGTTAGLRREDGEDPLRPSADSRLVDVNCDGPLDRPFLGPQLVADAGLRASYGPRVLSTTLAVAWVAAGRRAAYVSDGAFVDNLHFAAGIAICRAAGCVVSDLRGDELGSGRGLLVAADTATHDDLVELVAPHLAALG